MMYYFKKPKTFMKAFVAINIFLLLMTNYSFTNNESDFIQKIPAQSGIFYSPRGVAVDSDGNIYVTDGGNHRIQFIEIFPPEVITTNPENNQTLKTIKP